ncbi:MULTISPECIES: hypothetical protein [Oscillatoriales]|uniref:hypothetical protein n=1 Tax=Oscillatoriophycideae TaxID=1301283 RepID=UPI001689A376|nr:MULTISPECIES: hypothetical protein [Oscillatoriales]
MVTMFPQCETIKLSSQISDRDLIADENNQLNLAQLSERSRNLALSNKIAC